MIRRQPSGHNRAVNSGKPAQLVAPTVSGGDKEVIIVFEKKAVYKKPSFISK